MSASNSTKAPNRWRLAVMLLGIAVLVSAFTTFLGERRPIHVEPELVWMSTMGNKHQATSAKTVEAAAVTNVARFQGLLGVCLGLTFGVVTALAFHQSRRLAPAATAGVFTGAIVGLGIAKLAVPLFFKSRDIVELDLIPSILLHGGLAATLGLTTGLAAAIGASFQGKRLIETLFTVSTAAFLGGAIYVIVGAAFFANDDTGEPVSVTLITRALSHALVALSIAIGTTVALIQKPPAVEVSTESTPQNDTESVPSLT